MHNRFEVTPQASQVLAKFIAETPDAAGKGVRVFFSGYG